MLVLVLLAALLVDAWHTPRDSAVLDYIAEQKNYVALTNTQDLPPHIKPYQKIITAYFYRDLLKLHERYCAKHPNGYFIHLDNFSFREDTNFVEISVSHYDGFVEEKIIRDANRTETRRRNDGYIVVTDINGNRSGCDGAVKIDKKTKKVVSFSLWM